MSFLHTWRSSKCFGHHSIRIIAERFRKQSITSVFSTPGGILQLHVLRPAPPLSLQSVFPPVESAVRIPPASVSAPWVSSYQNGTTRQWRWTTTVAQKGPHKDPNQYIMHLRIGCHFRVKWASKRKWNLLKLASIWSAFEFSIQLLFSYHHRVPLSSWGIPKPNLTPASFVS